MSEVSDQQKTMYFQYVTELNYPIFISFSEAQFEREEMGVLLESVGFSPVEEKKVKDLREKEPYFRILKIKKAGGRVAQQIVGTHSTSNFGSERIDEGKGFQIYRHKNCAMIVYSFRSQEWEAGVLDNFCSDYTQKESKIVLARYISWSLGAMGVCGIWGVKVEEGMTVMRPNQSKGECVFFDIERNVLISNDGVEPLTPDFKFIRLDKTLRNRTKYMTREDLLSFLPMHTSYFSSAGLSVPIRQLISKLAVSYCGEVYPAQNFMPRANPNQSV